MSNLTFKPNFKHRDLSFERIVGAIDEGLNQVRDFSADGYRASLERSKSRALVVELIKVIAKGGKLDPIIVHPHSEEYGVYREKLSPFYIIDGHHRLQAYKEAYKRGLLESKQIAVKVLTNANRNQAREYAFSINQKAHLNMTDNQRIQEAWVTLWREWDRFKGLSYRAITEALNGAIGKTLVGGMVKAIKNATVEDEYIGRQLNAIEPRIDPWKTFRRKYEPNGERIDTEERKEKAKVFAKEKVLRLAEHPEWNILEEDDRLELVGILLGQQVYLEEDPEETDW